MEKLIDAFDKRLAGTGVSLPRNIKEQPYPGEIKRPDGWTIKYVFGTNERGQYIDYYSTHHMTNDTHSRLYEDGTEEELPAIAEPFLFSFSGDGTETEEELERRFQEHNDKVSTEISIKFRGFTDTEFAAMVERCQTLPPTESNFIVKDYVDNLLITALDLQVQPSVSERAMAFYHTHRRETLRTHHDLRHLLNRYPDTKQGDIELAQHLWGYDLWNRVRFLRRLLLCLERFNVSSQEELNSWVTDVRYDMFEEPKDLVKGFGSTMFKWLALRSGDDWPQADSRMHRFLLDTIGRPVSNETAVIAVVSTAKELKKTPNDLDKSIWEYQGRITAQKL